MDKVLDKELKPLSVFVDELDGVIKTVDDLGVRTYKNSKGEEYQRYTVRIVVQTADRDIYCYYFLAPSFAQGYINVLSELYRLMEQQKVKRISELVGKRVHLKKKDRYWRIVV